MWLAGPIVCAISGTSRPARRRKNFFTAAHGRPPINGSIGGRLYLASRKAALPGHSAARSPSTARAISASLGKSGMALVLCLVRAVISFNCGQRSWLCRST